MEIVFLPISLLSRYYSGSSFECFSSIPAILMIVGFFYLLGKRQRAFDIDFSFGALLITIIIILCQGGSIIRTLLEFPLAGKGLWNQFGLFLTLLIYLIFSYIFLKNWLNTEKQIENFYRGFYIATLALLSIAILQWAFIRLGWFESFLTWLNNHFGQLSYSESSNSAAKNVGIGYLKSAKVPNFLDPERRDLVIKLFLISLPFLLSAYRMNFPLFKNEVKKSVIITFSLCASVCVMLFSLGSTTSLVFGVIGLLLLVIFSVLKLLDKDFSMKFSIPLLLLFAVIVPFFIPGNHWLSDIFIDNKDVENRKASIDALLTTFLHHPIIGVGYNLENIVGMLHINPTFAFNDSNIQNYLSKNVLPSTNVLFSWLAQFGLVVIMPLFFVWIKLKFDFSILLNRMEKIDLLSKEQKSIYRTINESCFLFTLFLIPSSLLLFDWRSPSYVMIVAFFFVTKNYLEKRLSQLSHVANGEK